VNNRKVLDGAMESIGLSGDENSMKRLTALRAIDKLDRLGHEGVRLLLGPGRKDESGDFTSGAGLSEAQAIDLLRVIGLSTKHMMRLEQASKHDRYKALIIVDDEITESSGKPDVVLNSLILDEWRPILENTEAGREGLQELEEIAEYVRAAGYGSKRIRIDPSVVRGLEYYTGPVYEVELLIETKDDKGRPVRFGSVGGGGRYDGLVSRFMGQPVPATGFSIGVSRLQAALAALGKLGDNRPAGPVLVTVFGPDSVAAAQALVGRLRGAKIRAELYLGNPKHGIGQQLKYADRRSSPCAVIQGPDEKAKGQVVIRDLIAGAAPSDTADREAHLRKQAEAQVAVSESEFVEAVRKLLARRGLAN